MITVITDNRLWTEWGNIVCKRKRMITTLDTHTQAIEEINTNYRNRKNSSSVARMPNEEWELWTILPWRQQGIERRFWQWYSDATKTQAAIREETGLEFVENLAAFKALNR